MDCQDQPDAGALEPSPTWERYAEEIVRVERLIATAQAERSLAAEAEANEQAARFYLEWGKEKIAAIYLQDAHNGYRKLGDRAKTAELEQNYPQLIAQLEKTNYFTHEFIATISHEFRTPLNGILGMSEALLEEVFGTMNERQLNAVSTIDRSGGYLLALLDNMADLSKIQVGKLELEITSVSVSELCQSSITFVKHHAIQKQIQLDTDIPEDAGEIAVDPQRMRQVLINLLNHAIDSTAVGGRVGLVVTKHQLGKGVTPNCSIEFAIIDTSKEISPANDPPLSSSSLLPSNQRIGLGLMLVNPIVELHGGSLSFQSTIGRGSCVNVSLPHTCLIADPSFDSEASFEYIPSASANLGDEVPQPPLILIAEDNELNINTISSYLTAKGYRPIVAQDGESAIELTQKHLPDLILMDIQMPGMDGLEAISRIRQQPELEPIPIIALTALAMEGDREKCLAVGANEYLTKPVKLKQLNDIIQQFLVLQTSQASEYSDFLI
jgi:signal transduction histidine kinase/CheY-like chemotaxis protein